MAASPSASTSAFPPIPTNISSATGPALMGIILNGWLYGILTVQVYIYRLWYPKDRKGIKLLVYGVFALETLQISLSNYDGFRWFVFGYGDVRSLVEPGAAAYQGPILNAILAFIVQTFFCWRIWKLGKTLLLPGIIFIVALTAVAGGLASGIQTIQLNDMLKVNSDLVDSPLVWLSASSLTDTLIAGTMTYILLRARTQYRRTDDIILRIVRLTVETGSLSAGVAVITLVVFRAFPGRSYFACPGIALGKLYSNTLLVIFNNRIYLSRNSPVGDTILSTGTTSTNIIPIQQIKFRPYIRGPSCENQSSPFSQPLNPEVETPIAVQLGEVGQDTMKRSSGTDVTTSSEV